jgi:hypothetical protein
MSTNHTDLMDAPLTASELQRLHRYLPDATLVEPDGQIISKLSRREISELQARFPTMVPDESGPAPLPPGVDPVLAARYPTMFKAK